MNALVEVDPSFEFTAAAFTHGFVGSPHIDKQNLGPFYGLALGNFPEGTATTTSLSVCLSLSFSLSLSLARSLISVSSFLLLFVLLNVHTEEHTSYANMSSMPPLVDHMIYDLTFVAFAHSSV